MPEDVQGVAAVHVRTWQSAYRGLIGQEFLDSLRPEQWIGKYNFGHPGPRTPATVVAVDGSDIVGFATTGRCRDRDLPDHGELYAIYVDPARWEGGVGSLLLTASRDQLHRHGLVEAALWVVDGNARARRFYERHGWTFDGTRRTEHFANQPVDELRYRTTI